MNWCVRRAQVLGSYSLCVGRERNIDECILVIILLLKLYVEWERHACARRLIDAAERHNFFSTSIVSVWRISLVRKKGRCRRW